MKVDYGRVLPWREQQFRAAAAGFLASGLGRGDKMAFAAWCTSQADWLDDYALFMAIRSPLGGQPWWDWPAGLASVVSRRPWLQRARAAADEFAFWQFVQWCFDTQSCRAQGLCQQQGRAPDGRPAHLDVAHDSADCWSRPDLYDLDENFQTTVVAGVPPDAMSTAGQRWGNPLYRWDRMAAENYAWWTARVKRALSQADVFRIDHFRGFAGYYEIPASSPDAKQGAVAGKGPGKALFDAIEASLRQAAHRG